MSTRDIEVTEPETDSGVVANRKPKVEIDAGDAAGGGVTDARVRVLPQSVVDFFRKERFLVGLILLLAVVTRFYHFGEPRQIVLDEVYFPKFVTDYFKGAYFFDIHPPLAKLMMAGWAKMLGAEPPVDFDFKKIGKEYPSNFYMYLRFLTCFFGVLLPLAVYLLARELFESRWSAFLAALFVVFDNAVVTQSRHILIDVFLLFFGVAGLWLMFLARKQRFGSRSWFVLMGLAALGLACCVSVKWTGATFIGLAGLVLLYDLYQSRKWTQFVAQAGMLVFVGFWVYFSFFAIHFQLLHKSGDGDAFMSAQFRATLTDSRGYDPRAEPLGMFSKFTELNRVMLNANASITATHSYSSKWYSWPLMIRPMYYWVSSGHDGRSSKIYLMGNPIIWWLAFAAFLYWTGWSVWKLLGRRRDAHLAPVIWLLLGYVCNLLAYIMVSRVAFIYHYLPSLLMMMMGLGLFFDRYWKKTRYVAVAAIVVAAVLFVYFAPLSYGLPLSDQAYQGRIWIKSWQ